MSAVKCHGCDADVPPSKNPGVPRKWCSEKCRKLTLYSRRCIDCGGVCNTDGRVTNASERCLSCSTIHLHDNRRWTRDAIVDAIHLWADESGGVPPVASDWQVTKGSPRFPPTTTVQREFDTWAAAIEAAGFVPFAVGRYGREGEDPQVIAETVHLYRAGLTCDEIGLRFGVTGQCIRHRLVVAGEPRRQPGPRRKVAA